MTITAQLTLGDGERSMNLSLCSIALAKLAETLIDHEDTAEATQMEALESRILGGLGWADPYAT